MLGELSVQVGKAYERYTAVGAALKPYAGSLDNARAESWGALQDAVIAASADRGRQHAESAGEGRQAAAWPEPYRGRPRSLRTRYATRHASATTASMAISTLLPVVRDFGTKTAWMPSKTAPQNVRPPKRKSTRCPRSPNSRESGVCTIGKLTCLSNRPSWSTPWSACSTR